MLNDNKMEEKSVEERLQQQQEEEEKESYVNEGPGIKLQIKRNTAV